MTLKRRVQRLESKQGAHEPEHNVIVISSVTAAADGPVSHGPYSALILKGQNAGTELKRGKDGSAEACETRCDASLWCAP